MRELQDVNAGLIKFLSEGTLTKEFILDNTNKILGALRRCNVTLRWLMLHSTPVRPGKRFDFIENAILENTFIFLEWETTKKCSQLREALVSDSRFGPQFLFALLLNSAQFELTVKDVSENFYFLKGFINSCDFLEISRDAERTPKRMSIAKKGHIGANE